MFSIDVEMEKSLLSKIIVFGVRIYQFAIAPLFPPACRHQPSCSRYMIEAIERHGPWAGLKLGIRRLGRCHPWGVFGYDPVPPASSPKTFADPDAKDVQTRNEHKDVV